jgi:hypothetical protein
MHRQPGVCMLPHAWQSCDHVHKCVCIKPNQSDQVAAVQVLPLQVRTWHASADLVSSEDAMGPLSVCNDATKQVNWIAISGSLKNADAKVKLSHLCKTSSCAVCRIPEVCIGRTDCWPSDCCLLPAARQPGNTQKGLSHAGVDSINGRKAICVFLH